MGTSTTFIDLRINSAEQLKESVSEPAATKLYLAYGRVNAWANDAAPNASNSSVASTYEVWNNMIGGKIISGADIRHVIPRQNWANGTVYFAYDDLNTDTYNTAKPFYVLTSEWNVFKCIANNKGGLSTVQPTALTPNYAITTSDGYVWRYMYTLSDEEKLRFLTTDYMPVKTLTADDGSRQWSVQSSAIPGAVESIVVTNEGANYSSVANVVITITGDGTSAKAIATLNSLSNGISTITMTDVGQNYTFGTVAITDLGNTGVNATARIVISPPNGHGSNPLYELGGKDLILNPRLAGSQDGVLPVVNDFRQISILKDPKISNGSAIFSNTAFLQASKVFTDPTATGNYILDEIVYQGTSTTNYTYKGRVVDWDSTNAIITLINTTGTFSAGQIVGDTSTTSRFAQAANTGALQPYTCQVLYMDNIKPITRSSDQTEDFKIIIKF